MKNRTRSIGRYWIIYFQCLFQICALKIPKSNRKVCITKKSFCRLLSYENTKNVWIAVKKIICFPLEIVGSFSHSKQYVSWYERATCTFSLNFCQFSYCKFHWDMLACLFGEFNITVTLSKIIPGYSVLLVFEAFRLHWMLHTFLWLHDWLKWHEIQNIF